MFKKIVFIKAFVIYSVRVPLQDCLHVNLYCNFNFSNLKFPAETFLSVQNLEVTLCVGIAGITFVTLGKLGST